MKTVLKQIMPPVITSIYRKLFAGISKPSDHVPHEFNAWTGDYSSWQQAKNHTTGYDDKLILEKCKNALLKVKNGEAKYERDSVLFDEIEYSWPLLAALQRCALENNNTLSVLDFGGSLGSTYFQNRSFLTGLDNISWHIVEQKNFVNEGKIFFEDNTLKFFYTAEVSMQYKKADLVILSSVLQYIEFPYKTLGDILALKVPYVVIDRTAFVNGSHDVLTVQNVPEEIYKASYPAWFFGIEYFKEQFKNYEIIAYFNAHEGYVIHLENGVIASYKGFILKYKYDS